MGKVEIDTKFNEMQGKEIEVPCSNCSTRTNHIVLQSAEVSGHEDFGHNTWFAWDDKYQIIQCRGCNTISFRHLHTNSEDYYQVGPDEWEQGIQEKLYPNRVEGRKKLEDTHFLPIKVRAIYGETHNALCDGLPVLVGIGLRAIIETVCKEKEADGKNLNEKIDSLVAKGMLTEDGAQILHKLRTLGNRAIHEVKPHSQDQLSLAMDVVEHLLEGAYIFLAKANRTLDE